MNKTQKNNRGFSLIEVLIALLLISVGVLGMVAMQGKAITYTQNSVQRNTAAMLAEDLMELIRTNQIDTPYLKAAGSAFPDAASTCTPTPSEPSEQAGCWAAKAGAQLPGASALLASHFVIERPAMLKNDASTGTIIQITLAWSVKNDECFDSALTGNDRDKCTYTLRAEL
ncbi:MAG: type IV pilus modification protein PilV [Pseudomonas sp.]